MKAIYLPHGCRETFNDCACDIEFPFSSRLGFFFRFFLTFPIMASMYILLYSTLSFELI